MKLTAKFLFIICAISISCTSKNPGEKILIDDGWRFHRGDVQQAEKPEFVDSTWRMVDLPHDWSLEDLPGTESPFHPEAISAVDGGFTTGGTGWYRKKLTIPADMKDRRFTLLFEGVSVVSEVWINGNPLGIHPYGYTTFFYDITSKIKPGEENVIAVKVKNEGRNSRWYYGSGIYRHVWLHVTSPVHIPVWGTSITSSAISEEAANLKLVTTVSNTTEKPAEIKLVTRFIDANGKDAGAIETKTTIKAGEPLNINQTADIRNPMLWSTENPHLYKAVSELYVSGSLSHRTETNFGIRTISADVTNGFLLNGKPVLLKGGCVHHDNGPLGSRAYDRAEERRVEILKASGYNAIRSAHNPPSTAFLDACDRLGMLVINEAFDMWNEPKNPDDYHKYFNEWWRKDIESMVLRDRNHPSVIMWSIGNEIPNRHKPEVVKVAQMLGDFIRYMDPSRPVTSAVNDLKPDKDPYFATLDISGYNYAAGGDHMQQSLYAKDHERVPQRVMYGAESYPLEAFSAWQGVLDHPYVIGDFVWTAFDYIGEASIGWRGYMQEKSFYPWNLAFCGDIDICGWKRPQSFYRDALWKENQLSLFVKPPQPSFPENPKRESWSKWHWLDHVAEWNWNGNEGKPLEVTVYSSCEEVELFLNGKSLGKKPTNRNSQFMASWQVPYQPGSIKAIGYTGNTQSNVSELTTAGPVTQIAMKADRAEIKANNHDLSYITVELTDANGNRNPAAENLLNFEIEGPGKIIAIGNANPVSTESYQLPRRKAWKGRCLVIVKAQKEAGKITLKAAAEGMTPATVSIQSVNPLDKP
jgi:beta-galactosidase